MTSSSCKRKSKETKVWVASITIYPDNRRRVETTIKVFETENLAIEWILKDVIDSWYDRYFFNGTPCEDNECELCTCEEKTEECENERSIPKLKTLEELRTYINQQTKHLQIEDEYDWEIEETTIISHLEKQEVVSSKEKKME